jgi:hypothetical protein
MGDQYTSNLTPSNRGVQQDQIKNQKGWRISHAALSIITSSTTYRKQVLAYSLATICPTESIKRSIQTCLAYERRSPKSQ